jgi:hypothetical protein
MDNTNATRNFIVTVPNLLDIDRGGGHHYGAPKILGVVGTLDEGILLLRSLGRTEGNIVEVVNPIMVNDRLVQVPNKVHEWKAPKARKTKKAA